ncbi:MAG TPA: peptidyl-prolyl cis-trans isomerase, partial [Urbifossiella sp.]|nr:peptidyl-prolyl cis-trans isomerase [Urbifossiella sp.]
TPFRRSFVLMVVVAAGCQTAAADRPAGRGQSPTDPVPGLPVAPPGPPVLSAPTAPPAPPTATPVGYTAPPVKAAVAALAGDPRIKVVAVVGLRNTITDQEVWEATRQRWYEYIRPTDGPKGQPTVHKDEAKAKEVYNDELRRLVERELVLDELETKLKKAGKASVLEDIRKFAGDMADRRLRDFKARNKVQTEEQFRAVLAVQGLSPAIIRRQLERQTMADEYIRSNLKEKGKTVSIGDVHRYYVEHPAEFTPAARVKWLDIFISPRKFEAPGPAQARELARAHAEKVRAAAAAGQDFVALCKQYDHGLTSTQNAEGIGQKKGEIQPEEVDAVVWTIPVGAVGPLVDTPAGFHIVKVVERQESALRPFDQTVQDEIREKLMRQLLEAEHKRMVAELWRRGVVRFPETP